MGGERISFEVLGLFCRFLTVTRSAQWLEDLLTKGGGEGVHVIKFKCASGSTGGAFEVVLSEYLVLFFASQPLAFLHGDEALHDFPSGAR